MPLLDFYSSDNKNINSAATNFASYIPLDFGSCKEWVWNPSNGYNEITRQAAGECFILLNPTVPKGSKIVVDDQFELDLIPQKPFFIPIEHKIKIKFTNFGSQQMGTAYSYYHSDNYTAVVFKRRSDYIDLTTLSDKFRVIIKVNNTQSTRLAPTIGSSVVSLQSHTTLVNERMCHKISKVVDPEALLLSHKPCSGYITFDNTDPNFHTDYKRFVTELSASYIDIDPIYYTNSGDMYWLLEFSNMNRTVRNESQIYDYKAALNLDTIYTWYYNIPEHVEQIYLRISDDNSVTYQNIWFTVIFPAGGINTLLSGSGVSSIGSTIVDVASANRFRIVVQTNSTTTNNCHIYAGCR